MLYEITNITVNVRLLNKLTNEIYGAIRGEIVRNKNTKKKSKGTKKRGKETSKSEYSRKRKGYKRKMRCENEQKIWKG